MINKDPENKTYLWSLQCVASTNIGTWTASEEPYLFFHMNSIESAGSTNTTYGQNEVFEINFKSGKTIYVEVPENVRIKFIEEAIRCIGRTK